MKCPSCKGRNTIVINSRPMDEGLRIMRRRECQDCNHRFTSYETIWSDEKKIPEPKPITDTERMDFVLKYCFFKTLGTATDFDFIPLRDRKQIDEQIQKAKNKSA